MKNFREIEQLSAYLDGQLNARDAATIETRIQSDPELASVIKDLRATRGLLRKLPARKAPRNFTLTRQMVGLKPPLPRTYPLFRLATVFATILFVLSFSVNALSPYFAFGYGGAAAPAPAAAFGIGGGGGGCDDCSSEAATEAPAATEEAPMLQMAPAETSVGESLPAETETARVAEPTPMTKLAPESTEQDQTQITENQAQVQNEAHASFTWTIIFLILALLSGLVMIVMRQSAARKWR